MIAKLVVESLLFSAKDPLSPRDIRKIFRDAEQSESTEITQQMAALKEGEILALVDELRQEYLHAGRAYAVEESSQGFRLVSRPEFAPWVRLIFGQPKPARLSAPAMETLAIIAYRQPISRAEIESVRGVAVDGVLTTLVERGFARAKGRSDLPGRPMLYETTEVFLAHFGLKNLSELPNSDELRRPATPEPAPTENAPAEDLAPTLPLEENHEPQNTQEPDRQN